MPKEHQQQVIKLTLHLQFSEMNVLSMHFAECAKYFHLFHAIWFAASVAIANNVSIIFSGC